MKKILSLLLMVFVFSSCEKDDICADETTPKLVIEFFDISNPSNTKNILNLKVQEVGQTDAYNTFSGKSKIEIPLKISNTTTKYSFVLNSSDAANLNEDFLEFNYTTQNVYVSRACGYKTTFELNNTNSGLIYSEGNDNRWMQNVVKVTNSITTQNETHLKIYF